MSTLTIRNFDDELKRLLRLSAASKSISMEEEIRRILKAYLLGQKCNKGLGSRIASRFSRIGGVELPDPERTSPREPQLSVEDK